MILESLKNCHTALPLHPGFEQAFAFLRRADLRKLPPGTYEIDGKRVFAIMVRETGNSKEGATLETHQQYIDIQCVLGGTDEMGWKTKARCLKPLAAYDVESDAQDFADAPDSWFTVAPDSFAIFFPEDAHTAMISAGIIHKAIIKVAVNPG